MKEDAKSEPFPSLRWLERMAEAEDRYPSVSVGGLAADLGMLRRELPERPRIFGRFLEFARRDKGLSLEALAEAADVSLAELVALETTTGTTPSPRTIRQLAEVLKLPAATLMELSGLAQPREELAEASVRFAARSEPIARLSDSEKKAFEEFVKVLVESSR